MAITTPTNNIKTLPGLKSLWVETKGDRDLRQIHDAIKTEQFI